MGNNRLIPAIRGDMVNGLHKLVRLSLYYNEGFTIDEHLKWVIENFELIHAKLTTAVKCPKHGWVPSIKKRYGNRCYKCYRNRLLYKKRASKKDRPKE